ncbi:hypothetical protein ACOX9X_18315 [Photobacterium leiognathi subsp. mandapamensis]|uniref:hypothetical protein n=1 Tax=Photobacterium leiognathi TaxID=553611 RepID=UPI003BF48DC3
MKEKIKHLLVSRFVLTILFFVFLNMIIIALTYHQTSTWIGHTRLPDRTYTTHLVQYRNDLDIYVATYHLDIDKVNSKHYQYVISQTTKNANVLKNDNMGIPVANHRYFAIDDVCTLAFRTPSKASINNVSMSCLY